MGNDRIQSLPRILQRFQGRERLYGKIDFLSHGWCRGHFEDYVGNIIVMPVDALGSFGAVAQSSKHIIIISGNAEQGAWAR